MIKAIIFDCFGVLTTDKWKEFVSTLPKEQKQPARDSNHAYDAGFIKEDEFLDQVYKLTGRSPGEVERLLDNETNKNTELLGYIASLKSDYKIGLLSNIASNWIRDSFLSAEEQSRFDEMILSFQVGMTKPDPRIFEIACQRLEVEPAEAIMVDDIDTYCESARSIGMQAVVYQNFQQAKAELEQILSHS